MKSVCQECNNPLTNDGLNGVYVYISSKITKVPVLLYGDNYMMDALIYSAHLKCGICGETQEKTPYNGSWEKTLRDAEKYFPGKCIVNKTERQSK